MVLPETKELLADAAVQQYEPVNCGTIVVKMDVPHSLFATLEQQLVKQSGVKRRKFGQGSTLSISSMDSLCHSLQVGGEAGWLSLEHSPYLVAAVVTQGSPCLISHRAGGNWLLTLKLSVVKYRTIDMD